MTVLARLTLIFAVVGVALIPPPGEDDAASAAVSPPRGPNILVFMTDDQRIDTMDVMPRTRRWFEEEGREFTNMNVNIPLCCPSRASIMTGQHVHNHGVVNNYAHGQLDHGTTLQRYLRRKGYHTAIVGKFLNFWKLKQDPPYFSKWAVQRHGYHGEKYNINGNVRKIKRYTTDFIRKQAVKILRFFDRKKDKRPWLLYVNPFAPHHPMKPAKRHRTAPVPPWDIPPSVNEPDRSDKHPALQTADRSMTELTNFRNGQFRTLYSVDQLVHRIMKEVVRLRENRRTLAVFTSDNGFFWGEHGLVDKRWPYREVVQVPFYLRWPRWVTPGTTDDRIASMVDLVPTLMQAARVSPGPAVDGRSLLAPSSREETLIEHFRDPLFPHVPEWASILGQTYQYVEYYGEDGQTVEFQEYYDLEADPLQLDNLLQDGDPTDPPMEEIAALQVRLAEYRDCRGTSGANACP